MEINYPLETTYFISYNDNDENVHYGQINPDQCMVTAKEHIFTTLVKQEFIDELLTYGITYEEKNPSTL
jgi:hypothetical protein